MTSRRVDVFEMVIRRAVLFRKVRDNYGMEYLRAEAGFLGFIYAAMEVKQSTPGDSPMAHARTVQHQIRESVDDMRLLKPIIDCTAHSERTGID